MINEGYHVRFGCAEGSDLIVPALAKAGFEITALGAPLDPNEILGAVVEPVDLLVVDHYGIDADYERVIKPFADTILVIDDLADRVHVCDILIDQTFGRRAVDYKGLVPECATVLAGAQYALLRSEFAATRESSLARRATARIVERIFISMGLTDLGGITIEVLDAVLAADTGATIDVVLGPNAMSLEAVRERAARRGGITVHVETTDICALMAVADLAVGAAGTTAWERCCLGLPTVTLALADNQRDTCRYLAEAGALFPAGTIEEIATGISQLAASYDDLQSMSAAAAAVTDGQGTARLISILRALSDSTNFMESLAHRSSGAGPCS
jgi:UDP-2,4-diacetamido-2,4,6-trideoxy-beta-L-altropyranose hydrolase